jgi:hypothetical protein
MLLEEFMGTAACKCKGFGVVTGPHAAIEAVACVFIPVNLNFEMPLADLAHSLGGDVCVELAKVKLNGNSRIPISRRGTLTVC